MMLTNIKNELQLEFYRETKLKEVELNGRKVRIPEEWEVKRVKEIGKVVTGKTPPTKKKEYWDGEIPFITPADFKGTPYVHYTERSVTKEWAKISKILLPPKTVLVVCIGSIGEVALTFTESVTNQQINAIIPYRDIDPEFVYYSLKLYGKMLRMWAGTVAVPIVKKSLFEKFQIPLPPLHEQKKIAEVLRSIDEAIQAVEESIEKLERLKKGTMEQLLTKGIGHTKFKTVELNGRKVEIPAEWEVVELGHLIDLKNGKRPVFKENGPIPVYGANGIMGHTDKPLIEEGNIIIIGRVGASGEVHLARAPIWVSDNAMYSTKIKTELVSIDYLARFLKFFNLKKLTTKNVHPLLTKRAVMAVQIPLPPLEEQKQIAEILRTIDEAIEAKRQKKEKLECMKKAVMEKLLTGEVRVK